MDRSSVLRFGRHELDTVQRQVRQDGRPLALGSRAYDLLAALASRRGRVVGKDELLDLVWPGLVVQENNLQVQISTLRRLLGPQAITTVAGRGYRFTAAVDTPDAPSAGIRQPGPSLPAPAARKTNLPATSMPLLGRGADLAMLSALIPGGRLVTVLGAGGIGKSRLAQTLAQAMVDRWADGAWRVELAGLSDADRLPGAVAQAMGMALPGRAPALEELVAALASYNALLVIDNCEHLLDSVSALVQALLHGAPGITLLLTSQEPLRLLQEQQYRLAPLAVPPDAGSDAALDYGAVALFLARVRAVDPRFEPAPDALGLIVEVCRRLDGLPLAIELAAARVPTLGLRQVRDRLDARFMLLTGGARTGLLRHQTLRATMAWSVQLLDGQGQALFRRLGIHAGGFTVEGARAVALDMAQDEWALLDTLGTLVDKSLVVATPGDSPRYHLLESARAYALEQLTPEERAENRRLHALGMVGLCARVDALHLDGEMRTEQLQAWLVPEIDNLRAAWAWANEQPGRVELAVTIAASANALEEFAVESTHWLLSLQAAVERHEVSPPATARYWRALASTNTASSGQLTHLAQRRAAELACALYREQQQPRRMFSSLIQGAVHSLAGSEDPATCAQALREADAARALVAADWPDMLRVRLLRLDAYLARRTGRYDESVAMQRQVIGISAATGDWLLEMMARESLATTWWEAGAIDDALAEGIRLVDALRSRAVNILDTVSVHTLLVGMLSESGRLDQAWALAHATLPLMRRAWWGEVEPWIDLFWRRGLHEPAARLLGASDEQHRRSGRALRLKEQQPIAEARAALQAALPPADFERALATGAALPVQGLLALIAASLAGPG